MTEDELVEKIADAIRWSSESGGWSDMARAALAVFREHTVSGSAPADDERARIEQSNEVSNIVFDEVKKVWPDLHPVLDLRYGIADALWDAGFRRGAPAEPAVTATSIARVVPNDPITSACSSGYCPSGCSHMMWKCDTCQCEGGWGAPVGRLEDFAAEHICPVDPAPAEPAVTVTDEMVERGLKVSREFPMKRGLDNARNVMRAVLEAALNTQEGS